ncbi:MAG: MmgE/PrpD family protein [Parvibaculum sp.]
MTQKDTKPDNASLSRRLVDHIQSKAVSEADLESAALFTLDAIANTCAGANSDPGRILLAWAKEGGNAAPDTGKQAFLWGSLTHILETDDLHRQSVVHPGCVVIPPAWVVATRRNATGRDFLTSVLHGFEATTRVGMGVGPEHYRIWHNTSTCGPFGSAMAVSSLLNLNAAAATNALGNAGSQAAGLWEFLETGAMTKHLHAGHAAEAGVRAAELAAFGFSGPPKILEGEKGFFRAACPDAKPDAVLSVLDAPWQLTITSIKPWPSCRHTHPAIDAAIAIRTEMKRRSLPIDAIEYVSVDVYQAAMDVCDRPDPGSEYEAKFSLYHTVAAALARDVVNFEAFGPDARNDLAALRAKIAVKVADPYASAYPASWGSAVRLTLKSGEVITETRSNAKGDPEAPLSKAEMVAKAEMLLAHAGVDDPTPFIDAVLGLVSADKLPDLPVAL